MYYPFCTSYLSGDPIEVVQTPLDSNGVTVVHFEKPDVIYGFKTLDCTVPYYRVSGIVGFSEEEVADLVDFCMNNAGTLLTGASIKGGFENA